MKKIYLVITILILSACSMLPPSAERFEDSLKSKLGTKERGFWGQKVKTANDHKEWFYYDKNINCKYIIITDLNDVITGYKILTPDTCKLGITAAP